MVPFAVRPPPPPPYYAVHPLSALTSADLPAYRSSAILLEEDIEAHTGAAMLLLLLVAGFGVVTIVVFLFAPQIR